MTKDSSMEIDIPEGLGPGDVPSKLAWPRSLWIILPKIATDAQAKSINKLRTELSGKTDIRITEVRIQNRRGVGGILYPLVPAKDVAGLYRRAHRARTAIIAFCGAKILLNISELPTNKGCTSLEKFVQYKCSYTLVTRPEEVVRALAAALNWMDGIHCEGPRDPRCLPDAVFETTREYPLATPQERQEFIRVHRASKRSNDLTDARRRTWQIGPEHTFDLIQVAGQTLPIGFHWDVQASNKSSTIATGWETWHLPGRGYTNVHPDALIRGGNVTKLYPPSTEKREQRPPRTPRSSRQRKGRH
jgi:hypothetical protein